MPSLHDVLAVIRINKKWTAVEKFLDPSLSYAIHTKSDIPAAMMIGIFKVFIVFELPPRYRETVKSSHVITKSLPISSSSTVRSFTLFHNPNKFI